MSIINSGSLEPATSDSAVLSYDKVTFSDCCNEQAARAQTPPPPPALSPKCTDCIEPNYESQIETAILKANDEPLSVKEVEEITVLGNRGIWSNREEVSEWKSDISLGEYQINEDPNPIIIRKKYQNDLVYEQELAVRYLKPPPPPIPGDIIIQHEPNKLIAPAPPLIIRQTAPRPCTPEPLVVREAPPPPPEPIGRKIITIAGKGIPPPPRKVIIERLPIIPAKPQAIINERWLPYEEQKRRVIYQAPPPDPVYCKPKNIIIQWDAPNVRIEQTTKFLGVVNANPAEYINRYGETLKKYAEFPDILKNIVHDENIVLAADFKPKQTVDLIGDVEALSLINLEAEGLAEYANILNNSSKGDHASAHIKSDSFSESSPIEGSLEQSN